MSFQDKLKPINATSTPSGASFESKLRPVTPSQPTQAPAPTPVSVPERGFLGTRPGDSMFGKVIDNSVTRGIQRVFPGAKVGENIGTLGGFFLTGAKEKLGMAPQGATQAYNLKAPTPLQTAGDVAQGAATIAGLKLPAPAAGGALKTIGRTAVQGGAIGAVGGAGTAAENTSENALPTARDLAEVAKGAAAGGATGAAVSGGVSATGQLLKAWGTGIQNSVIKPIKADIDDGFTIETVRKYNLGGSLETTADKTEQLMNNITRQLNQKLAATNNTINMNDVYAATARQMTTDKTKTFGANKGVASALENLKGELDELGDVSGLKITDAQVVKQAAGSYGAWVYGVVDPDATSRQKVYNVFYRELRKAIEQNSPDGVQELNRQLSELIPVKNAVIRRIPVAARNNVLSLTDIISLSATAVDASALGAFAASRAVKSGAFGNFLANQGQRIQGGAIPLGALAGMGAGAASTPATTLPPLTQ